jgi:hypothetical protein
MMGKPEILLTGDGFPTLYSAHFNEIYHSPDGSIIVSNHVLSETHWKQNLPKV